MRIRKDYIYLAIAVLVSFCLYLTWSWLLEGMGFPLDDAWIHQTYARNLGLEFQWNFIEGSPSGGSTGPAWGFLIGILYLLGLPPVIGTFVYGFVLLWGTTIVGLRILKELNVQVAKYLIVICILIAFEWHLIWSALSGMETTLLILIILLVFEWLLRRDERWWIPGVLIGLSVWVRPDGLTLLGPVLVVFIIEVKNSRILPRKITLFLVSFFSLFLLYCLFNVRVAGDIWPNTFYAKQAEYAILRETGLHIRYIKLVTQFITGVGILLAPGIILEVVEMIREKNWTRAAGMIWVIGYIGLYAWRLPVTYQHGRYIMPAMPMGFIFGIAGLMKWVDLRSKIHWKRLVSGAWLGSALVITVAFWILGGRAYARDVAVINTEMVVTANWINEITEVDSIIAAHDIGALGYYSEREILDLAGLITPEVISFIRDERELKRYLDQKNVDYLMTFPDWYPELSSGLEIAYQSGGNYSPEYGQKNMTVYYWK